MRGDDAVKSWYSEFLCVVIQPTYEEVLKEMITKFSYCYWMLLNVINESTVGLYQERYDLI